MPLQPLRVAHRLSVLVPGRLAAVDLHWIRPWIAAAYEEGAIFIWNYVAQETVLEYSPAVALEVFCVPTDFVMH